MAHVAEVFLTNRGALRRKYRDHFPTVWKALEALGRADAKRGLSHQVIAIDDQKVMRRFGGAPARANDPRSNKAAVDAIYQALTPDYIVIVGSIDIVPHQDLRNPAADDGDPIAFSDLPYACDAGYSTEIADFRGPTRVVGRIPDTTAVSDPTLFFRYLKSASGWKSRRQADYSNYLGVSAAVWEGSTKQSLTNVFGNSDSLRLSPKQGPYWTRTQLRNRAHYFNCHGASEDAHFYGQRGNNYPKAHNASYLSGKLVDGTILAAECCYGTQLYDPALAQDQVGICNAYLASGAYGAFGSSTIAYGPSNANQYADVICQLFLRSVLAGASLGRATLEARQSYVAKVSALGPVDLKTLAQFNLMGHPSITAIGMPVAKSVMDKRMLVGSPWIDPDAGRADRRQSLSAMGVAVGDATGYARSEAGEPAQMIRRDLDRLSTRFGMKGAKVLTFAVATPPGGAKTPLTVAAVGETRFHVLLNPRQHVKGPVRFRLVQAREQAGRIVAVEELFAR
jgi:hypothetical protein